MVQTHDWCIKTKSPCYNDDDTVIDDIGFMKTTATSNGEDVHEREREKESLKTGGSMLKSRCSHEHPDL